jgi:hypothetical protein
MYQNTIFLGTSFPLLGRLLHTYVGIGELGKEGWSQITPDTHFAS